MTYLCEISRTYGEGSGRNVESKGDGRTLAGCGGTDFKPIPPLNFTHSPSQVNDFFHWVTIYWSQSGGKWSGLDHIGGAPQTEKKKGVGRQSWVHSEVRGET